MKMERKRARGANRVRPQAPRNPHTRYIPQHVKDLVWQRDEGMCQYVSPDGQLRGGRGFLEFDHIEPFAKCLFSRRSNGNSRLLELTGSVAMIASFEGLGYLALPDVDGDGKEDLYRKQTSQPSESSSNAGFQYASTLMFRMSRDQFQTERASPAEIYSSGMVSIMGVQDHDGDSINEIFLYAPQSYDTDKGVYEPKGNTLRIYKWR